MKQPFYVFIVASLFAVTTLSANAATLEATISKPSTLNPDGYEAHGQWVSKEELDISFDTNYEVFDRIDEKSMRFELDSDAVRLYYTIVQSDPAPGQPIPTCDNRVTLTYKIKGLPYKAYQIETVTTYQGPVRRLQALPPGAVSSKPAPLKVSILKDGSLLLDGKPTTQAALEQTLKDNFNYRTPVWIYNEHLWNDTSKPQPQAGGDEVGEWLVTQIQTQRLPYEIARKPDFSDAGHNG